MQNDGTFSITEIGSPGEVSYKTVQFDGFINTIKDNRIFIEAVPPFKMPKNETNFHLTGQDVLADLCNLFDMINPIEHALVNIEEIVAVWCGLNMCPYNLKSIDELLSEIANDKDKELSYIKFYEFLKNDASFFLDDFITDLSKVCNAFKFYYALHRIRFYGETKYARELNYEGRISDGLPFLEKYNKYTDDNDYIKAIKPDYNELMEKLIYIIPDTRFRLKYDKFRRRTTFIADIDSIFDIAWYALARMIAVEGPVADQDVDDYYRYDTVISCMACGKYFVRRNNRQKYCDDENCQAERNRKNRNACYARKKSKI